MSTLVLLSVDAEDAAREGFARLLELHAVALLTLQGCALIGPTEHGHRLLIDGPPDAVGVQHVDVVPAFAPLVHTLLPATAETTGVAANNDVAALLARDEWVLVFLASAIAEGEVVRQLEFLQAQRVTLTLTDDELERLETLDPAEGLAAAE